MKKNLFILCFLYWIDNPSGLSLSLQNKLGLVRLERWLSRYMVLSKQSQWPEFRSEDSHNSPRTLPALVTQVYEGKDRRITGLLASGLAKKRQVSGSKRDSASKEYVKSDGGGHQLA